MKKSISQLLNEAITAQKEAKYKDAKELYRQILKIDPKHSAALNNLGYMTQFNNNLKDNLEESEALYKKGLENNANSKELNLNLGFVLAKMHKFDEAEKYLKKTIELDSGNLEAYRALGTSLKFLGKLKEAEINYKILVELNPRDFIAFNNLGNILRDLKKFDEAELNFKKAITIKPDFYQAYNNLGLLMSKIKKLGDAVKCYQKALQINPNFASAHNNIGNISKKLDRFEEAETSYKKAIKIEPNLLLANFNLGTTLKHLNRLDEAETTYKKAIEIDPNYVDTYNNLGGVLFELGKLEEAEECFKKAIALKPDNPEYLVNFSMVLDYLNKSDEAKLQLEKIPRLLADKHSLRGKINLAIYKFLEDDFTLSKKYLSESSEVMQIFVPELENYRIYHGYLTKILSSLQDKPSNIDEKIYVIGDSHALVSHGISVPLSKNNFLCKSILIMGCTQWELGNSSKNKYKIKFENTIRSLPKSSKILLSIGEIDCRLNYGIIKHNDKYPKKNRLDLVKFTIENYLNYIHKINSLYQHKITIQGVPAPNVNQINSSKEKIKELQDLINNFNIVLKDKSIEMGFSFLDLYALTSNSDGSSNKIWHIDTHHLSRKAMVESWRLHLKK